MSDSGHDLRDAFPADGETLHRLKLESADFRVLADRYHELARTIHRIEAGIDAAADDRLETLKKERLALLDEVGGLIAARRAA